MSNSVIYYPYINVPENEWFVRTLLYWDEVFSIVPADYYYNPHKLSVFTGNLVNNGLVKSLMPMDYIYQIPNFNESFIELLDLKKKFAPFHDELSLMNSKKIHVEKMEQISSELIDRKLAKVACYPWYYVENDTADLFMAYLACVIGKSRNIPMEPITDLPVQLSLFNKRYELSQLESDFISMRWGVLESILPSPLGDEFDIDKLVEFKENNGGLTRKFRMSIEKALIKIAQIEDENIKYREYELFREEATVTVDEIISAMKNYWEEIRWGTVYSVVPPSINFSANIAIGNWGEAIKYFPPLVQSIFSAFQSEKDIQERIMENPLSYAALAHRQL